MDKLHDLKDKLCEELEEIARKPDMGAGDLEVIHKLTDTIKNIDKICALEEDGGYSSAVDGMEYGRGSSYANRGQHYVRGHYRYSRDDGREEMIEHVRMAIDTAPDEYKEDIKRFMRELENA